MVFVRVLRWSGLYSYAPRGERTQNEVKFSKRSIVVGPNDAGKSNIFRVLLLLCDLLPPKSRALQASDVYSDEASASIDAELILSEEETSILIDYLGFYKVKLEGSNTEEMRVHSFTNRRLLSTSLRFIRLSVGWQRDSQNNLAATIDIEFEKIGLKFHKSSQYVGMLVTDSFQADGNLTGYTLYDGVIPELLDDSADLKHLKDNIRQKFSAKGRVYAQMLDLQESIPAKLSETDKITLRKLQSFVGVSPGYGNPIPFLLLLGTILGNKIVQSVGSNSFLRNNLRRANLSSLDMNKAVSVQPAIGQTTNDKTIYVIRARDNELEFTFQLEQDGWNLARFLYSLKMTENPSYRDRFETIRARFKGIFGTYEFDVVVKPPEQTRFSNSEDVPIYPYIVVKNTRIGKQFPLEDAGAGLAECIYLLTIAVGLKDSVLLLDEPSLNLHPPLMKRMMRELEAANQVMIITHSPQLAHFEIFDEKADLLYVTRGSGSSSASYLKNSSSWLGMDRSKLSYTIDTRIFFAKGVVLCEGETDLILLNLAARHLKIDLETADRITVQVNGSGNFQKYCKLLRRFKIPFFILADTDNADSLSLQKKVESCTGKRMKYELIKKDAIQDPGVSNFSFIDGNPEEFMKSLDEELYSRTRRKVSQQEGGREPPKPLVAEEFFTELFKRDPKQLDSSIRPFLIKVLES